MLILRDLKLFVMHRFHKNTLQITMNVSITMISDDTLKLMVPVEFVEVGLVNFAHLKVKKYN